MIAVLSIVIVCLVILVIVQFQRNRHRHQQLKTLVTELQHEQYTSNPILIMTNDQTMQQLLTSINTIVEHQEKLQVQFHRTEDSFKKMLANMSHDLKTPLTVVLGYIETIQNDKRMEAAERQRLLENMHKKTYEIIRLMNSFFDLARLESGDVQFAMERVNVNEVCRKSILSFYDFIQKEGIEAVIDIPDTPVFTYATEEVLERILNNLLSNALHYGHAGNVLGIHLQFTETLISIEVWDKGQGIAEIDHNKVFERLFTLSESRNRAFQGSGLGLTITKRLVEAIGGTITLKSDPFIKTTFIVQLKRLTF